MRETSNPPPSPVYSLTRNKISSSLRMCLISCWNMHFSVCCSIHFKICASYHICFSGGTFSFILCWPLLLNLRARHWRCPRPSSIRAGGACTAWLPFTESNSSEFDASVTSHWKPIYGEFFSTILVGAGGEARWRKGDVACHHIG